MCSITGMIDFSGRQFTDGQVAEQMGRCMKHRGQDDSGIFISDEAVLQHNRLSVIDPSGSAQPMSVTHEGARYTIVYNGELYNTAELRADLRSRGAVFTTAGDTEAVLYSYIIYGKRCAEQLNGIFAFCVYDERRHCCFLARDRLGVKPLFYARLGSTLLFGSEIKSLLAHPDIPHTVDRRGIWQLLFLSPITINGSGIFSQLQELLPAQCAIFDREGLHTHRYWQLEAFELGDSAEQAAERTRELMTDAITRQLVSDVPLCTLLSGGLDSSVISAVAAREYAARGERLATYSFEYEGNAQSFKRSLFQPAGDDEFARYLAGHLGTEHTVLTAPTQTVADYLERATRHRDFPGQADIDSSLLYFCEQIKQRHTVALSGECSDEIFGGYPWFYRPEMLERDFFPWVHQPRLRAELFSPDFAQPEQGYEFISSVYRDALAECPTVQSEGAAMRQSRLATWLSVNYFMTSLLERKDRMSMASSLEVRVPFADHRILEYVFNVPWEIKFENGVEKALLRRAMREYLPDKILYRKKSPYPKTHNPAYEQAVTQLLFERLSGGSRLRELLDHDRLAQLLTADGVTWLGQLMGKAQLIAWLLQMDCWMDQYSVEFI